MRNSWFYDRVWTTIAGRMVGTVRYDTYGYSWTVYTRSKDGIYIKKVAEGHEGGLFRARRRVGQVIKDREDTGRESTWRHMK